MPSLHDPVNAEGMRAFTDVASAPQLIDDPYHAEKLEMPSMPQQITPRTLTSEHVLPAGAAPQPPALR